MTPVQPVSNVPVQWLSGSSTSRGRAAGGDGPAGNVQQQQSQGFQGVTVQPQLEAYLQKIRLELLGEVQVLRTLLTRELQVAQQGGLRPSF